MKHIESMTAVKRGAPNNKLKAKLPKFNLFAFGNQKRINIPPLPSCYFFMKGTFLYLYISPHVID